MAVWHDYKLRGRLGKGFLTQIYHLCQLTSCLWKAYPSNDGFMSDWNGNSVDNVNVAVW